MAGTLYLVPNLLGLVPPADVLPARTLAVARTLRHFVVENAKPARRFLKSLGLEVPLQTIAMSEVSSTATVDDCRALLAPAREGADVGMLSDAGCPGIADPGAALVAAAHREGIRVAPLVGPSAILLGLMASGLDGQAFAFHGYLPVAPEPRLARLRTLDEDSVHTGATQLFIETPYRNAAMFAAMLVACRSTSQLCIAVDLTLTTEWIGSRTVREWQRSDPPALQRRPALFLLGRARA